MNRRALLLDLAAAVVLAGLVFVLSPGVAVTGMLAVLALVFVGVSWLVTRRRSPRPPGSDAPDAFRRALGPQAPDAPDTFRRPLGPQAPDTSRRAGESGSPGPSASQDAPRSTAHGSWGPRADYRRGRGPH